MSVTEDNVTRVSLRSCTDYLPRIRRIAACLADSVGMDRQQTEDAALVLNEACVNAIRHGSPNGADDRVSITFKSTHDTIVADVTDGGGPHPEVEKIDEGLGIRLMRLLSDHIELISGSDGLTVRLTKRAAKS